MKKLLLLLFVLLFSVAPLSAEGDSVDPKNNEEVSINFKTKRAANKFIVSVYKSIEKLKGRYKELEDFDDKALLKNEHGIYSIFYKTKITSGLYKGRYYGFGVTVTKEDDSNLYEDQSDELFDLSFPLIKMKVYGFKLLYLRTRQLDIENLVMDRADILWDYQQKFMPFELTLEPDKKKFLVYEDIQFTVKLKNKTRRNIKLRDLSDDTLFFLYNNKKWGAHLLEPLPTDGLDVILYPGKSISKKFIGNGFSIPKKFSIFCTYNMTYKGVKPSASLEVEVLKE